MVIKDFGEVKLALEAMAGSGGFVKSDVDVILKKAAKPMIEAMKAKAPEKTGRLKDSITVWSAKKRPYRVYVGPSYKLWNGGGRIAHIIEFGTVSRTMLKGLRAGGITQSTMQPFAGPPMFAPYKGKKLGAVAARPFIRPAVEATSNQVIENIKIAMMPYLLKQALQKGLVVK
jgi:HK97 gp10 family phage protein